MNEKKTPRAVALLPIAVFLVLYLGLGIVLEYVLKVKMGFYQIPIVVAFMVSILVACLQNRSISFDEKLNLMGQGIGDKNIVTMILIFLAAGVFVGVTGQMCIRDRFHPKSGQSCPGNSRRNISAPAGPFYPGPPGSAPLPPEIRRCQPSAPPGT